MIREVKGFTFIINGMNPFEGEEDGHYSRILYM
jgi:hypothetical protein